MERYNDKWQSKTPEEKKLTDEEVEHFIKSLLPVVFHILYNPFDEVSILVLFLVEAKKFLLNNMEGKQNNDKIMIRYFVSKIAEISRKTILQL